MKKLPRTKKLLLTAAKVRDLDGSRLEGVAGGLHGGDDSCSATFQCNSCTDTYPK